MTRQEKNEQFLLSSFLYGGNADYIERLYARYKADPGSVDATWASYFGRLEDSAQDALRSAEGPSWRRPDWPQPANGELVSALDGNWAEAERIALKARDKAEAQSRTEGATEPTCRGGRVGRPSNPAPPAAIGGFLHNDFPESYILARRPGLRCVPPSGTKVQRSRQHFLVLALL